MNTISNYKLCNLAARLMRAHIRIAQQAQYDPSLPATVPPTKDLIAASKAQLEQEEQDQVPQIVDCGSFDPQ
jgi:hypothetical protein